MIAYLEGKDATVEIPDDIGDKELGDIQQNFEKYVQPEQPHEAVQSAQSPTEATTTVPKLPIPTGIPGVNVPRGMSLPDIPKWVPNFYESYIKPTINSIGPFGLPAQLESLPEETRGPAEAFATSSLKQLTAGLAAPLLSSVDQEEKDHPVATNVGALTGGLGGLLATGGALRIAGLEGIAERIGTAGVEAGMASAQRFLPRAIMTGSTFGTQAFVAHTIKAFQDGNVDIAQFGKDVLLQTAGGAALGGAGQMMGRYPSVATASGIMFLMSKMEGGDNSEALLSAGMGAAFEFVGSFGKTPALIRAGLGHVEGSIDSYVKAKDPNLNPNGGMGRAIVTLEAQKYGGIEGLAKKENALQLIEDINQKIRQGKVPGPIQEMNAPKEIASASAETSPPPISLPSLTAKEAEFRASPPSIQANLESPTKSQYDAEQVPGVVFPQTEISSQESISNHPDFVQITKDAEAVTKKYAKQLGIEPTAHLAESIFRAIHSDQNATARAMRAAKSPEEMEAIKKEYDQRWPDADREFATLHSKLYSDITEGWFKRNEAGKYGSMRPQIALEAEEFDKHLETFSNMPEEEVPEDLKAVYNEMQPGGTSGFAEKGFASTRGTNRNYGSPSDEKASIKNKIGGLEYIKKMKGPELVKLARSISGDVPVIQKLMKALGYFRPGNETIALSKDIFKDQPLWEAVLAHEIGHLMDFNPEKTMNRGNILGRIASLRNYRKSLLPESPKSTEEILTDEDRRRFRSEAERHVLGEKGRAEPKEPDNEFTPQDILDIWNSISKKIDPDLLDYVKGLDVERKKNLIKAAMVALRKNEKIKVFDVKKLSSFYGRDADTEKKRVADIYTELVKEEIKKRRLWENEVISSELKKLSMYWKPFDASAGMAYARYRYSSPELYADFVSVLLNAPAKAKEIAPHAYEAFFNYLENKPEVMSNLLELQALIQSDDSDLQKVRGDDILSMFERGEDAFRTRQQNIKEANKSTWDKLRIIFWDKNAILLDERNRLEKKEDIAPSQDAQYAVEKNSLMGSFVKSYLEDFDRFVYTPAKEKEVLNYVKAILFLDRVGADRAELANPLGHTPETAKLLLEDLKRREPDKYAKASEIADAARTWFRDVSNIPGSEDFFSPTQRSLMGMSDKYAPFRVVDYMQDYVSAGFSSQVGTFKDIGDPLTSTAMKGVSIATAIERNRLKKIMGQMLLKSGVEIRPAKVTKFPAFKIQEAPEKYLDSIAWKENGDWVAYHVDKDIADAVNNTPTEKIGQISAAFNTIFQNNFFRSLWITFNPSFQAVNLFRDFQRTWKTTPGLSIGKAFANYIRAIGPARARVSGIHDPLIQEMERAGALQLTLNDLILGQTSEDRELEAVLQKFDIIESPESKYEGIPIIKQISTILDWMRYTGDIIETIPKVAAWKALDNMDTEERAYFVRNLAGTPNFKRSGTGAPVFNTIYMFANIFKEGFRGLIESAFTNPKTRKGYWVKTIEANIIPKIIMAMAAAGFFGAGIKAVMDKASEYHKANYIVIPMGVNEDGNAVYITLPQDEDGRLIGAIFWKMINRNGNAVKNLTDILSFGAGQFPGFAPTISIGKAWLDFLDNGNPRDNFRGQDILTDQEKAAGGLYAFEPMARWTLNQLGLVRLDIRDRFKNEPLYKTILSSAPIIQRFIRVGNQGERELARAAAAQQAEARRNLDEAQIARDAIRSGQGASDFISSAKTPEEMKDRQRTFKYQSKKNTNDPFVQALNSATSTDQKVAILRKISERYENSSDYEDYLNDLYKQGIISSKVAIKARH